MRSDPVQLNVCDLFYAILFVPDKSLRIEADYAAACVADHQTPALSLQKVPSKDLLLCIV